MKFCETSSLFELSVCVSEHLLICLYLSIYLSFFLPFYLSIYLYLILSEHLSIFLPIWLSAYLSFYLSIYSVCLCLSVSACLSNCPICLIICLCIYPFIYLSVCLSICLPETGNKAILRDFLKNGCAQIQNEAILRDVTEMCKTKQACLKRVNAHSSKTMKFLRGFFNFRTWEHQKRSNSARLPWKIESWVQTWRPRSNAFCRVSTPCVSTAPATKVEPRRTAAPVTRHDLSKPEDLMLQNASQEMSALTV